MGGQSLGSGGGQEARDDGTRENHSSTTPRSNDGDQGLEEGAAIIGLFIPNSWTLWNSVKITRGKNLA